MNKLLRLAKLVELDLRTLPCQLFDKKEKAEWHLKYVCPHCPKWRRDMRDVNGTGECWWLERWSEGDFGIDPHFGVGNWVRQYFGLPTNLDKWKRQ